MGNARLEGGVEDGLEIDVAWPPASPMFRRVDDRIVEYELQDGLSDESPPRLRFKAAKTHKHVDPDPRGQDDGGTSEATGGGEPQAPRRRTGGRGA